MLLCPLQRSQPASASAPAALLPAWEDESGLDDVDVDQLVSQHLNRVSPPVMPAARPGPAQQQPNPQHAVRPAAAAAAAVVRSSAVPVSTPPVTLPPALAPAGPGSFLSGMQSEPPKYPAAALGLEGIKERIIDLGSLLLDAQVDPEQSAALQEERRSLMDLKNKLQAAQAGSQHSRPPPDAFSGTPASLHRPAQAFPANLGNANTSGRAAPHSSGTSSQPAQGNNWQPSIAKAVQAPSLWTNCGPSTDVWDTAAANSNSWTQQKQGQGSTAYAGSSSFAYDAPDPAPRDDMGMPEPDPMLRASASGEPEGFATCHQHDGLEDKRWDATFPWSDELKKVLARNFGTKTFRANQKQAINASLAGKDVFVLMPTGGGELFLCCIQSAACGQQASLQPVMLPCDLKGFFSYKCGQHVEHEM